MPVEAEDVALRPIDALIITAARGEDEAVREVSGASSPWKWRKPTREVPLDLWRAEFPAQDGRGTLTVALARAIEMGTDASAHAAAALTQVLRPRCLAMSGVCAGRPGWTNLGDVIIADRVYRYDVGEIVNSTPGGVGRFNADLMTFPFRAQWRHAAERFLPAPAILQPEARPLPREIQAEWVLRELNAGRDPRTSAERVAQCADWEDVAGALERDGLVTIRTGSALLTPSGKERVERLLFEHPDGIPAPPLFKIHVGPLGTGSSLIRDVDIWERLSSDQRMLRGFDMEASVIGLAAFIHEIPWVVVKGVMDFGQPDRTQGFRKFAARAAAEVLVGFLRENLEPMPADLSVRGETSTDHSNETLASEIAAYLAELRAEVEDIPGIFPKGSERGDVFAIHQKARVIASSHDYDRRLSERAALEQRTFAEGGVGEGPLRAWDEQEPRKRRGELQTGIDPAAKRSARPELINWDEAVWTRFPNGGRLVLLGDPGFGKTTTLCAEALSLVLRWEEHLRSSEAPQAAALELPIFFRLPDLEDAEFGEGFVSILASRMLGKTKHRSGAFAAFVRTRLESGRAALFLDALDEVADQKKRERMVYALDELGRAYGGRVCVTSRIIGYDRTLGSRFTTLEMCGFDSPQIERFASCWFQSAGRSELKAPFLAEIADRLELAGLARVPITLALLSRVFESPDSDGVHRLPDRRVDLYARALDEFVRDRGARRRKNHAWSRKYLGLLKDVLVHAAVLGAERLTEEVLIQLIVKVLLLPAEPDHGWAEAEARAVAELNEILALGILVPVGRGGDRRYLPLHRSFGEYLVAQGVAVRIARDGWKKWESLIDAWAWRPERSETLALTAGCLAASSKRQEAEQLLALLGDRNRDDDLRHRLAVAVRCAAELDRSVPGRRAVVAAAFDTWWRHSSEGTDAAVAHLARTLPQMARIDRDEGELTVLGTLLSGLGPPDRTWSSAEESSLRAQACRALELMGAAAATPEVIPALFERLWGDLTSENPVAGALRAMRPLTATTARVGAMLSQLKRGDAPGKRRAIAGLAVLGSAAATPEVIDALLACLKRDSRLRNAASEALGEMGDAAATAATDAALARRIDGEWLHSNGVHVLENMGAAAATPGVIAALIALLRDDWDFGRVSAVAGLGALGVRQPLISAALVERLRQDEPGVRVAAADVLNTLGALPSRKDAVDAILAGFRADDRNALLVVERIGSPIATPEIVDAVLPYLESPVDLVRHRAARALGALGRNAATPVVIRALANHEDDTDIRPDRFDVGREARAARSILEAYAALGASIDALARRLEVDLEGVCRVITAEGTTASSPRMFEILLSHLERAQRYGGCAQLGEALAVVILAGPPPTSLDRLFTLCSSNYAQVRSAAAAALAAASRTGARRVRGDTTTVDRLSRRADGPRS